MITISIFSDMPRKEKEQVAVFDDKIEIVTLLGSILVDYGIKISEKAHTYSETLTIVRNIIKTPQLDENGITMVILDMNFTEGCRNCEEGERLYFKIKDKNPLLPIALFSSSSKVPRSISFDLELNKDDLSTVPSAIRSYRRRFPIVGSGYYKVDRAAGFLLQYPQYAN